MSDKSAPQQDARTFDDDPYTWEHLSGWKSYRALRPFRGMYWDVRRRLPYYWSDIRDGWSYRTFAGTVRIFFVNLLPALAFELDMMRQTGGYFGINEALFSSALAALVFSLASCQPLTVVGITGLISLFNYTIYDIAVAQGIAALYPQFIAWVSIWAAITHWLVAVCNWCDYMRYITDFSSNAFGTYVSIIYLIKGVEELVAGFEESNPAAGYLGIVIALCFWFSVVVLERAGSSLLGKPWFRKLLSDYAYPIATIFWTGFSHIPGRIESAGLPRIPHTPAFHPTVARSWLVDFWTLPAKWVFVALPIGALLTLLFYYDHNVSSLTAQAKQFPLKKPAGFHWDFFLLGGTSFVAGILGLPLPNGLVPQAPVHTDALTEYGERRAVRRETEDDDGGDGDAGGQRGRRPVAVHHRKVVVAERVHEQRVSHFLMGLGFVGLMTGPLLSVLHTMPRALFAGVFFVVGWSGIPGFNTTQNLLYCLTDAQYISPDDARTRLPRRRILLYTAFQLVGVAASVAISQTIAAIGFPVIITALIPLRWCIMPRVFTEEELLILDAPTADSPIVLCSMGGQPERPEVARANRRRAARRDAETGGVGEEFGGGGGGGIGSGSGKSSASDVVRAREGYRHGEGGEKEKEIASGEGPRLPVS